MGQDSYKQADRYSLLRLKLIKKATEPDAL